MNGKAIINPPNIEILTLTIKPCCIPVKINSGGLSCFERISTIGLAKKLKTVLEKGNTPITQIIKANSDQISLDLSSVRCSINVAFPNSISSPSSNFLFIIHPTLKQK